MDKINHSENGSRGYLASIVMVAVLGGLLFGYDTAVISGAEKGLQAFFLGAPDFKYSDFMHGSRRRRLSSAASSDQPCRDFSPAGLAVRSR